MMLDVWDGAYSISHRLSHNFTHYLPPTTYALLLAHTYSYAPLHNLLNEMGRRQALRARQEPELPCVRRGLVIHVHDRLAPLRRRDDDVDVVVLEELFGDDQGGVAQDLVHELAVACSEGVRRVGWRGWRGLWGGCAGWDEMEGWMTRMK